MRWRESLETMVAARVTGFVELGPGSVLTGMAKRGAPEATAKAVGRPEDLDALVEWLRSS